MRLRVEQLDVRAALKRVEHRHPVVVVVVVVVARPRRRLASARVDRVAASTRRDVDRATDP
jgi:hypothetical protein